MLIKIKVKTEESEKKVMYYLKKFAEENFQNPAEIKIEND